MSYTPHTWVNGETITAAKMNNIEEGIGTGGGSGVLMATYTPSDEGNNGGSGDSGVVVTGGMTKSGNQQTGGIFSHTWQELYDAIDNDIPVFIKVSDPNGIGYNINLLDAIYVENGVYIIAFGDGFNGISLGTDSSNGYVIEENSGDNELEDK